ncbi:uncharacterized protein EI97DRAFT_385026 [Westerdykella ornata]|uniref:DUF974-domain-containing protein n=1 Tax=Westerdykella ornata TaxID=318751 RepID=A0A6A6J8M0_WESOR|nr:uncharacterized protein EI97DRAFT_385026 [Westerdykella ornata]KAF2272715.1 hypothetical protein EI97DRAFT_385026 [Westerdykella ornata]
MAHQRSQSLIDGAHKSPHSVSLKVLRLSRPSLAFQYPLPNAHSIGINPAAALAYPSPNASEEKFILSPVLNLPEAFGSAYVGETFSCTLCANNELDPADKTRAVSGVKMTGEMQTPSTPQGAPLELAGDEGKDEGEEKSPAPGESLQKILRFELKEEGNHVLAVTVTYTENTFVAGEDGSMTASGGRVRQFRKLYQFVAQQLLSVRTKTGVVGSAGRETKDGDLKVLLEAQLENMGEGPLSLEAVHVNAKHPFKATALNWDMPSPGPPPLNAPVLNPREVIQVAFLLEQAASEQDEQQDVAQLAGEERRVLGQLAIQWHSALGDRGSLSTGWLSCRR